MERVLIFDTTLRDGEQSPGSTMTPDEKIRMAHQLDQLGVDIIEAGFPVTTPDDFAAVKRVAAEVRRPVIAALARASTKDIEVAAAAIEPAERGRLHVFLATSEVHLKHKLRISEEECFDRAVEAVRRARIYADDVEFSAEDATRTDPDFLCRIVGGAIQAGATTVNIPDTVGYAHPAEIRRMVERLFRSVPAMVDVVASIHCHNDLGLAVANSITAVEAGARQVECTVNGIGERAGNAALEEVVMALDVRRDAFPFETGIRTAEIHPTSQLLSFVTGVTPQPNKAIVGRNAFAHEAGIHQDGMIKNPATYEIMTPDRVGVPGSSLVVGKHCGRNALNRRYREMGFELNPDDLDRAWKRVKRLADQKKTIEDEDLISILNHEGSQNPPSVYRLRELDVMCGKRQAEARVVLSENCGRERVGTGGGNGPIDAAFAAIDSVIECRPVLQELKIGSATPGQDALGEVSVRVRVDGRCLTGRGASPDVVHGAVRAYLNALDKAAQARVIEAETLEQASYLWGV